MSDDQVADLKQYIQDNNRVITEDLRQYIDSRASQTESLLRGEMTEMEVGLRKDIKELGDRMDNGFSGVAEAIDFIHKEIDDHEERITNLEQAA